MQIAKGESGGKMLHTSLVQPTKDDDAVNDVGFEGAVDPVQQTEVPPNLHVSSSRCQQLHGMCHPVRALAVTRQNTRTTFGDSRRGATELNASCDEHDEQTSPCVHATLPAAEQEEVVVSPRGPSTVRRSQEGIRTNEITPANQRQLTTAGHSRPSTRPTCSDQALQETRGTTSATNSSRPTVPAPSVVVQPQAIAIQRLGAEIITPPAEPVSRLTRESSSLNRSLAAGLADSGTERSIPVSSVDAHSLDLQPSPMFLSCGDNLICCETSHPSCHKMHGYW